MKSHLSIPGCPALVTVQSKLGTELADLANGSLDAIVSTVSLEKLLMKSAETGAGLDRRAFREMPIGRDETVVFLIRASRSRN